MGNTEELLFVVVVVLDVLVVFVLDVGVDLKALVVDVTFIGLLF